MKTLHKLFFGLICTAWKTYDSHVGVNDYHISVCRCGRVMSVAISVQCETPKLHLWPKLPEAKI